ncbi:zinc finger CCCH domain-containing protein 32-like [Rutidosis leptorrhynchoides]|uniref:zinc finger CCCH domain-containing protein 32-like n=1 Tax=Rutidosis leptorrhynchoides TaxID=125765 RepID=UPI003A997E65
MDEEELHKRLTDCVYYLASPLTCKKGIECEYRHSEMARLNPRDCWYWLGGCCFNPDCAFRHPPLEGLKEAYHESINPNDGPAVPLIKTNVPCYFYSKGYCNKGDKCSFLHGPADGYKSSKPVSPVNNAVPLENKLSKAVSQVNNAIPLEKKLSAGNNTLSTPFESHSDPADSAQIEQTQQLASESTEKGDSSEENLISSDSRVSRDETVHTESDQSSDLKPYEVVHNESDAYNDQSPDMKTYGYVERESWMESPPRFDVFVNNGSKRVAYEKDGTDYYSVHDDVHMDLDVHHTNPIDHHQHNEKRYGVLERLDKVSEQSRGSIFYRLSYKKRNGPTEPVYSNRRRGTDLRDLLKKHRVVDFKGCNIDHRFRRNPPRHVSRGGEVDFDYRGNAWKTVSVNKYRQPIRKPRFFTAEVSKSRKSTLKPSRDNGSFNRAAIFTGPKTLDQIKEEKKKAVQTRDNGSFNRGESDGFQGPRSLTELLKDKRKLG